MRIFIVFIFLNSLPVFAQDKELLILDSEKFLIHFEETKQIGEKIDSLEFTLDLQKDYLIKGSSKSDITDLKNDMRWAIGGSYLFTVLLVGGLAGFLKFGWKDLVDRISRINDKLDRLTMKKE